MTAQLERENLLAEVRLQARQAALRRRRRVILVVAGALAIVTVIAGTVVQQWRSDHRDVVVPAALPRGVGTGDGGWSGIEASRGPVSVEVYLDFLCPSCRRLEEEIAPLLASLAASQRARVVYRPVAMLDSYSAPEGYSSRAAAAAGCAADQGRFVPFAAALFARQPPERGPGLTDEAFVAAATDAGAQAGPFRTCLSAQRYLPWSDSATQEAYRKGIVGTPTLLVDGRKVDITEPGVAARLDAAVRDAAER